MHNSLLRYTAVLICTAVLGVVSLVRADVPAINEKLGCSIESAKTPIAPGSHDGKSADKSRRERLAASHYLEASRCALSGNILAAQYLADRAMEYGGINGRKADWLIADMHGEDMKPPQDIYRDVVESLQFSLSHLGFYEKSGIDGIMGARTSRAIKKYEVSRGLQPTGRPSPLLDIMVFESAMAVLISGIEDPFPQQKTVVRQESDRNSTDRAKSKQPRSHSGIDHVLLCAQQEFTCIESCPAGPYENTKDARCALNCIERHKKC